MTESEHSTFSDRCADLVTTHPVFRCDHTAMADGCYFCVQSSGPCHWIWSRRRNRFVTDASAPGDAIARR